MRILLTNDDGINASGLVILGARATPAHSTDLEAIVDGYIDVTPLNLDLTDRQALVGISACFPVT